MKKFIEIILNHFGFERRKDGEALIQSENKTQEHADLFVKTIRQEEEIKALNAHISLLEAKIKLDRVPIAIEATDPGPIETSKRKSYVGQVAGFHSSIMAKKMHSLINDARISIESFDSTLAPDGRKITDFSRQEFDLILRGTINAYWQIFNWGEQMVNEQLSYQLPEKKDEDEPTDYYKDRDIEDS